MLGLESPAKAASLQAVAKGAGAAQATNLFSGAGGGVGGGAAGAAPNNLSAFSPAAASGNFSALFASSGAKPVAPVASSAVPEHPVLPKVAPKPSTEAGLLAEIQRILKTHNEKKLPLLEKKLG